MYYHRLSKKDFILQTTINKSYTFPHKFKHLLPLILNTSEFLGLLTQMYLDSDNVVHSDEYFKDRRIKSIAIHKIQFEGGDYEHEYHQACSKNDY